MRIELSYGRMPTKGSDGAAGYDLYTPFELTLQPGQIHLVKLGFKAAVRPGTVALIRDRSGLAVRGITTRAGVIDSDYRGEWGVVLVNESEYPYTAQKWDRIAQVLILPLHGEAFVQDVLDDTDRGSGGFGSTGK